MPTGKTTDAIAMNFSRYYAFITHLCFEGYSTWYKIDEMVNNYSNSCK